MYVAYSNEISLVFSQPASALAIMFCMQNCAMMSNMYLYTLIISDDKLLLDQTGVFIELHQTTELCSRVQAGA